MALDGGIPVNLSTGRRVGNERGDRRQRAIAVERCADRLGWVGWIVGLVSHLHEDWWLRCHELVADGGFGPRQTHRLLSKSIVLRY